MSTQISKNIFWLSLSRVAALVLLFLAYTRLFRYLGPYSSGQYQFILSYVLIFSTVVDFGIQQFITKKISEQPENTKQFFHNFFSFEVFSSAFLYTLLAALAYFRHYDQAVFAGILLAGLGMVANALTYPFLAVMAAYQDLRKVAFINFLNSLVNISVIFSAIFFHKHIVFLASVQLLFGILGFVLYRIFVTKHIQKPEILKGLQPFNFPLILGILKQGWPFALLVGFSAIYNRIDVVIITFLKGYQDTGYYTAAYKIFDLLGFFPSVVSYTLFPFFAGLMAKKAIGEVKNSLEKYMRLMFALALPMAVGGMLLSSKLISLVAGPEYEPAAPVLAVLIWAPAILFMYIPLNSLVISQLTKKALVITGINVLINVLGNLLLVPRYGIQAAAYMTVISELIQGTFYFYFVGSSITKFAFFSSVYKVIAASGIMAAVLWYVRTGPLVLALLIGLLVYVLSLVLVGFLKKDDIYVLKSLLSK